MLDPNLTMLACKLCGGPATRSYRVERAYDAFDLLECDACGFHFIDHLDGPADWQALTVPLTTAEVAGCLECNTRRIEENAALLREHGSGRVLDVGCGAGGFLARIGSDHYATGLELDPRYVAVARDRGLNVIDCPLEATEWDGERFDTITLWDVIEHVNDPLKTARRVRGLLAPGGVLLMDTPNRDGPLYRFGQFTALLTRGRRLTTMSAQYSAFVGCHKQIFRKADMRTMLERAGFTDIQISIRSELSLPVARYLQCLGLSAGAVRLLTPIASAIIRILPVRNKMIVVAKRAIVRKKVRQAFLISKSMGVRLLHSINDQLPGALILCPEDAADQRSVLADFRALAAQSGAEFQIVMNREEARQALARYRPDIAFVCGWYWLLDQAVLDLASKGFYGIHNGPLPRYRGGAPLVWQIINGEPEIGSTMFKLGAGADDGDIVHQFRFPLDRDQTISDATTIIEDHFETVFPELWNGLKLGVQELAQQDHSAATTVPQRRPEHGKIDWTWPASRIHDFIRAQSAPYPGAFTDAGIVEASEETSVRPDTPVGEITRLGLVRCGDGASLRVRLRNALIAPQPKYWR